MELAPNLLRLDAKDVRIFCEIAFRDLSYSASAQRHVSPTEIGRKLDLDEKTVRSRIRKMEEDGFIKYYQAVPSPSLFGLGYLSLHRFGAMNIVTKKKMIEGLKQIPNVVEAVDYIGPTVSVNFAGSSPEQIQTTAAGIATRFELAESKLGTRTVRDSGVRVDHLDWQLIQKLRFDARMTATDLANSLGITSRVAEYRVNKLLDSGDLLIRAVIDTQKQAGLLFYEMELSVDAAARGNVVDSLRRKYGEKLWSVNSPSSGLLLANMFAFTFGEPEEAAIGVLEHDGVRYCSLLLLKEVIEPVRPNWMDGLIEKKIAG